MSLSIACVFLLQYAASAPAAGATQKHHHHHHRHHQCGHYMKNAGALHLTTDKTTQKKTQEKLREYEMTVCWKWRRNSNRCATDNAMTWLSAGPTEDLSSWWPRNWSHSPWRPTTTLGMVHKARRKRLKRKDDVQRMHNLWWDTTTNGLTIQRHKLDDEETSISSIGYVLCTRNHASAE